MKPSYPAPGGPASQLRFPGGSVFYFRSASEPVSGLMRLLRGPAMFRPPMDHETKLGPDETIFGRGEDGRKLALATSPPNEATTGRQGPRQGTVMIKAFSAVAIAAFVAAALTVLPGFAPQVEASVPVALAKGDRLDIKHVGRGCSEQAWPNFESSCLRGAGNKLVVREARLVTADRTP